MDEQIDLQESQQPDEELNLDLELEPEEASPEAQDDVEAIRQRLYEVEAKNKQLYARLKKQAPVEKPNLKSSSNEDLQEVTKTVRELKLLETKRQFGYEHNLSPQEVDAIYKINPNPSKETLEDPFVKGGLAAIRAKKSVENAIPGSSKRSPSVNGKSFAEMTKEERAKNWTTVIAKSVGR